MNFVEVIATATTCKLPFRRRSWRAAYLLSISDEGKLFNHWSGSYVSSKDILSVEDITATDWTTVEKASTNIAEYGNGDRIIIKDTVYVYVNKKWYREDSAVAIGDLCGAFKATDK